MDELLKYGLQQGGWVLATMILAGVVVYQYRENRSCEKSRLADAHAAIPVMQGANEAMAAVAVEMASRTRMAGEMGEAMRRLHAAQEAMSDRLEKLYDYVRDQRPRS